MWVRLKSIQYLSVNGRPEPHYPGEWVEVGGQLGRQWLATHQADRPDLPDINALPGCGVLVKGALEQVESLLSGIDVVSSDQPEMLFSKTLFWNTTTKLKPEFVPAGFNFLERWEVAAPLASYERLAADIGEEADRRYTVEIIRDLRVPYYNPDILFFRRCEGAKDFLTAWAEEQEEGGDSRLAFLRALYRVKPLLQPLPVEWLQ